MSIRSCLDTAVKAKEITQAAADELDLIFNRFVEQHALIHGDAEARRRARDMIAKRMEVSAAHKRRVALLQAAAIERVNDNVMGYKGSRGEIDPARGLIELLETHGRRDEGLAMGSVDGRRKAILADVQGDNESFLDAMSRRWSGKRPGKMHLENFVRELFGEGTADQAAKEFAEAFSRTAEGMRQRYNENGGAIGKLEKWGLPQSHDAQAVRNAKFDAWAKFIGDRLDWDNMRHALTGDPILPGERAEVLQHAFGSITGKAIEGRSPSAIQQGRGALYKQHSDHRFFKFKDAAAWLEYDREFGSGGDPFASAINHINVMARDIAAMEMLGPNPEITLNFLKDRVKAEALKAERGEASKFSRGARVLGRELFGPEARAKSAIYRAEAMWDHYTGATDVAVLRPVADALATARNLITASSLGSTIVSAITDVPAQAFAMSFAAGVSRTGSVANQFSRIVHDMKGIDQSQAVRAGLILDTAVNVVGQRARQANLFSGPVMSRYVADWVMRKQLLQAWTQGKKHAFGLDLMGHVADQVSTRWADMRPEVQRMFRRYGFSEQDWDLLSLAKLHDLSPDGAGATILRPRDVRAMGVDDLGRMLVRDRRDALAARQALAAVEGQLYKVADEVRDDILSVIKSANASGATVPQIQNMLGTVLGRVPAKLRDQLSAITWSREGLLATLGDIAEGSYARTEMARLRWREGAEFQALPQWLRELFGDPETTLADVRETLRAIIDRERTPLDAPPSIPSDRAADKIRRYFRNLSERYNEMILQETTYAVPEATLRTRSIILGKTQPGTMMGEAARAFGQFKSFGTSLMLLHGGRVFHEIMQQGRVNSALSYGAGLLFGLTIFGTAVIQMRQLLLGEDPRDMTDWKTWSAGAMQGGGAGIYGDFFLADRSRHGTSLQSTLAGPLVGRMEQLLRLGPGNFQEASEGKKTNIGREVLRNIKSFDPLASLWFTKLAWDRIAYSELQRVLDPEASVAFRRRIEQARRDRKTEFWWRPGESRPDRAPDLGAAIGPR